MKATSFPVNCLPEPLKSYVVDGAAALDCDVAYIAVPLLSVLASAIGNTRRIRLKATWSEPAVIWTALVGESGTVKSPALELATRPLWLRQQMLLREYAKARAEYEAELQLWKDAPKDEREGERPQAPKPCEHVICSDVTMEALADRLMCSPRGILVALDELGGWFGSFNQYKGNGADVPHWLAMHGARALKIDRKTGDNKTIYIPNAGVSVTGTIQPDTLRRMLLPEFFDNGLAARLLVSMPNARPKKWTEAVIPDDVAAAVSKLFDTHFQLTAVNGVNGEIEPLMVDLDNGARQAWIGFFNQHNIEMQELEGAERAAWAKLECYAARFALIMHCCRQSARLKESDYVDVVDIEAGIELVKWFAVETRRVYFAMLEGAEDRQRRELRQWIANREGRVTVRDLQRGPRRYREDPNLAEEHLNDLVDRGLGAWQSVASGHRGRPTQYFCLADSPDFPIRRRGDGDTNTKHNGEIAISSPSPGIDQMGLETVVRDG